MTDDKIFEIMNVQDSEMQDPNYEIIQESGVNRYLSLIRPAWQAKNLVQRTLKILPVDPSSACQRIFNASIHDLREKVVVAGIDIAQEAAKTYKLPQIISEEDILERYDTGKLITLAYRMGLLSRPEYRRITRVYDIRKDLEHEDDQYEAGVEDVVYIFKTCSEIILANDPTQIIRLTDIKDIVEEPNPASVDQAVIDDYGQAPYPRQTDIYKFLISTALNNDHPDIVRQNSYNVLGTLKDYTKRETILELARYFIDKRLGRRAPTLGEMRVANASGILPYLRSAHISSFYSNYYSRMQEIGYHWTEHSSHGQLLRDLIEVGGLTNCPNEEKKLLLEWLLLLYIGESGGYGPHGVNRKVFFSNSGAPLAKEIIENDDTLSIELLEQVTQNSTTIRRLCKNKAVKRRLDEILDLFNE